MASSYPQPPVTPAGPQAPTSSLAIISLISGVVSWFALPFIGAIIAVITGHMARNEIRSSGGRLSGEGMAIAGLVLGYLHLAVVVVVACLVLIFLALGLSIPFVCLPFANQIDSWLIPSLGFLAAP